VRECKRGLSITRSAASADFQTSRYSTGILRRLIPVLGHYCRNISLNLIIVVPFYSVGIIQGPGI